MPGTTKLASLTASFFSSLFSKRYQFGKIESWAWEKLIKQFLSGLIRKNENFLVAMFTLPCDKNRALTELHMCNCPLVVLIMKRKTLHDVLVFVRRLSQKQRSNRLLNTFFFLFLRFLAESN